MSVWGGDLYRVLPGLGLHVVWCRAVLCSWLWMRVRGPVATPQLFQGFACSCCGLQGVVLRGGFILRFVVLMLVIQGGVFILWFEGGDAGL